MFAVNIELRKGAKISNNEMNNLILTYPDGVIIRRDQRVGTKKGWVSRADAYGIPEKRGEMAYLGREDSVDSPEQQKSQPKKSW